MTTTELLGNYRAIRKAIAAAALQAGRAADAAKLIAVSKTHPFEKIRELYQEGHRDFGENYVQEMIAKATQARAEGLTEIRWHFIGHLQSNKVKILLPWVFMIHGVSSLKLAEEISKRAEAAERPEKGPVRVLIEVNVDDEESKSGVRISEIRKLAEAIGTFPNLELRGLMAIPDPKRVGGAREAFHRMAALEAALRPLTRGDLSMGMTSDFSDAIAEGATYLRIGTAIFGSRSPREKL